MEILIFVLFTVLILAYAIPKFVEARGVPKDEGDDESVPEDLASLKTVILERDASSFNPKPIAYLSDLSLGGAKVIVEAELKKNERMVMRLDLENGNTIGVKCRMAWQRPLATGPKPIFVTGLAFGLIPPKKKALLSEYIAAH